GEIMKGLFEAVLNLEVTNGTEKAYKKAFEQENERYLTKHTLRDGNGHIVKDELESVWSGNYCHVDILYSIPARKSKLTISIVSRTLQNVKDAVTDYQMLGAELVHKNWE
ncbi:hypothetical protein HMPREF9506_02247, partial [Enterococcus faecalis TX0309A]